MDVSTPILVRLDSDSIESITNPTNFDILGLTVTILIGIGLGRFWWLRRQTSRLLPPDVEKFTYTVAGNNVEARTLLQILGTLSVQHGYGTYGSVGRLWQLTPDAELHYDSYRERIITAGVVDREWFTGYWDDYFVDEKVLSTKVLYLIQTTLLATVLPRLPLTVIKDYYSIAFDWLQELDFNENSKFLYLETFEELKVFLRKANVNRRKLISAQDLFRVSKSPSDNHKHLIWNKIK